MIDTLQAEQDKYTRMWGTPAYGEACYSFNLWHSHRHIFPTRFESAIDLGCGPGLLLNEWAAMGIDCLGVDIAANCLRPSVPRRLFKQACLWDMDLGRKFDLGVCADVMEHIPPEYVAQTLANIAKHCDVAIFKIAHVPDVCGGGNLHLTVQDQHWWRYEMKYHMGNDVELLGHVRRSGFSDSIWRWQV